MNPIKIVLITIAVFSCSLQVLAGGTVHGSIQSTSPKKLLNAVIYIDQISTPVAPSAKHEVMDQKNLLFIPHVLPIIKGTTVDFLNSDNVRHNVFSPSKEQYNLGTWPTGEVKSRTFDKEGVYVQLCNVHAEMEAYIVVLQNPYFCLTKKDGLFKIGKVPAGTYVLKAWQEKLKKVMEQTITVVDGQEIVANFTF